MPGHSASFGIETRGLGNPTIVLRATLAILLLIGSNLTSAKKTIVLRNGVRLTNGDGGPRGRLEVSSNATWMTRNWDGLEVVWRPFCAEGFEEVDATAICGLLGFKFGRPYAAPKASYRDPKPTAARREYPLMGLSCDPREKAAKGGYSHRALLSRHSHGDLPHDGPLHRHGRALSSPLRGTVNTPPNAPYSCAFRLGECPYEGPLAAVECSNKVFSPFPPSPPGPPSPPPAPPPRSNYLRLVGDDYTGPEPNLCPPGSTLRDARSCNNSARAEVLVAVPVAAPGGQAEVEGEAVDAGAAAAAAAGGASQLVWAPLCGSTNMTTLLDLASLLCQQARNFVNNPLRSARVSGWPYSPFPIPRGPVADPAYFDPARYTHWVRVVGGNPAAVGMVQDLTLKVSTTPCTDVGMFRVMCEQLA